MVAEANGATTTIAGSRLLASLPDYPDYYAILGLDHSATADMVHRAYWQIAHRFRSEAAIDMDAASRLDHLNDAYRILGSSLLRREYDLTRADTSPDRRPGVAPSAGNGAHPREVVRQLRSEERSAPAVRALEGLRTTPAPRERSRSSVAWPTSVPWLSVALAAVVLLLACFALVAGAGVEPVIALVVIGVGFSVVLPLAQKTAPGSPRQRAVGELHRPSNLDDTPVPGGRSQALRRLVYAIYEQNPHLGPADLRIVARYATLSQRFLRGERMLRRLGDVTPEGVPSSLAAEQRVLAAELRRHEAALAITTAARAALAVETPREAAPASPFA